MLRANHEHAIYLGSPGEEISIQDLQTIKQRFKRLNQIREQRAQDFLLPRQQVFLEILALLFHGNYPMLPGYVSSSAPAGIHDYTPSNETIASARQLAKNFHYTRTSTHNPPIEGLFLMGSVGSIAFSKTSDMDIWLCHQSDLLPEAINELQKKATAIETWAASLGLEVHFFLMDSQQFRLGQNTPISSESSGQTQHYLLLEEFYRTAIYIAGKSPAWWFVPPHEEGNYSGYINHLINKLFIPQHEIIDFGGFEAVPAEEFTSATLWHLYKALHSPHKSLLKLLLMECYASEFPQTEWLCQVIKKAVYQGDFMTTDLDPYLLIYQKVETYLQNAHSHSRLALARQSFYLKVMGSSDNTMDSPTRASRDLYIQQIAQRWNWPTQTIDELKHLRSWNIKKATSEHVIIVQQLTQCYRMIMGFAREHISTNHDNNNDLKLIGRKLHSFLERKPGKIEIITTRSEVHSKENSLSIVESRLAGNGSSWALYQKYVQMSNASDFEPIHKCRTLIEILCWMLINGLYHKQLQLNFSSYNLKLTDQELRSTLRHINLFLSQNYHYDSPLDVYQSPKFPLTSMILINLGISDSDRLCVISERSDALSYGKNRQCFIYSVHKITLSSWSEITTTQGEGITGLLDCFIDIINNNQKPLSSDIIKFVCHTPNRARGILYRVESVFNTLLKLFSDNQTNRFIRYIIPSGTSFYVFQSINKTLTYKELATEKQLLSELGSPQPQYCPVYFDQTILENTPINLIYSLNRPQVIQLFYFEQNNETHVYILDERGSLFVQTHINSPPIYLIKQYAIFLESILARNLYDTCYSIEYNDIKKNQNGEFVSSVKQVKSAPSNKDLSLRITGEDTQNGIIYTIYCNEKEFSSLDHGNHVFYAAYQDIVRFRNGNTNYPVYITDIDLPISIFRINNPSQLQTIHFLNYKQKIEDKFNV